jgi:hypothetical protein
MCLDTDVLSTGHVPPTTLGHGMARDSESGVIFVVGGFAGSALGRVTSVYAPRDLCSLWSSSKDLCRSVLGCSFCMMSWRDGTTASHCFKSGNNTQPQMCSSLNATVSTNKGSPCDSDWMAGRNCDQFATCAECLASWPSHHQEPSACRWCVGCRRCVRSDMDCLQHSGCPLALAGRVGSVTQLGQCAPSSASCTSATDCISCNAQREHCTWLRRPGSGILLIQTLHLSA